MRYRDPSVPCAPTAELATRWERSLLRAGWRCGEGDGLGVEAGFVVVAVGRGGTATIDGFAKPIGESPVRNRSVAVLARRARPRDRGKPDDFAEVLNRFQHRAAGGAEDSGLVRRTAGVQARPAWDAFVVRHRGSHFEVI
jgi:hypothetical protein